MPDLIGWHFPVNGFSLSDSGTIAMCGFIAKGLSIQKEIEHFPIILHVSFFHFFIVVKYT